MTPLLRGPRCLSDGNHRWGIHLASISHHERRPPSMIWAGQSKPAQSHQEMEGIMQAPFPVLDWIPPSEAAFS